MASNKTGMSEPREQSGSGLGGVLFGLIAAGITGGAFLVAGAKLLGEKLLEIDENRFERLEMRREADKEEVKRITAAEEGRDNYE